MFDEGSGAMEKKNPPRQSPAQPKNNGVISEKKSDYLSNKNGRGRKYKQGNGNGRLQEPVQNPRLPQKYNNSYSDKRPRSRGSFNYKSSEAVAEGDDILDLYDATGSRKGGANHLLQFTYTPLRESGCYGVGRGGRSGYWNHRRNPAPRYKPEQFLQASCQFVVKEGGEYSEQAINPDALVNWDMVELVRSFSNEKTICPICLQVPFAGKITKCGHVYCWACILHHLHEKEMMGAKPECPICPYKIATDELRSVQCKEVPDWKIGDEIEMKLMCKTRGSVYVAPVSQWKDREGIPHNIDDGDITQYMKLLVATCDQIQEQVLGLEKAALDALMIDAEEYETSYIAMAKDLLEQREVKLKMKIRSLSDSEVFVQVGHEKEVEKQESAATQNSVEVQPLPPDISFDGAKITTQYRDAFENEAENDSFPVSGKSMTDVQVDASVEVTGAFSALSDVFPTQEIALDLDHTDIATSQLMSLPVVSFASHVPGILTPEEAADHLELPGGSGAAFCQQTQSGYSKDTFYFYQASTGQHIYLSSLNCQCLTREYGSLEHSPHTIKGIIVAVERSFMNEELRKRLRYLNHVPLTCEFHVVELKLEPAAVSKETLRHFQPEFEKRRRARQKKLKEEKARAKQQEVEHKKSFGIFPEVHIPLDNLTQFPPHMTTSSNAETCALENRSVGGTNRQRQDSVMSASSDSVSEPSNDTISGNMRVENEGSQTSGVSFAEMLKVGKAVPQPSWRGQMLHQQNAPYASAAMSGLQTPSKHPVGVNEEDDGEYLPAPPIASSWFDDITKAMDANIGRCLFVEENGNRDTCPETSGNEKKKKKKKKEKQLLFSTSMARKG